MEMCLAWGKLPSEVERAPWHTRQRMWKFWVFKHERENALQEKAQAEAKAGARR